MKIIYEYITHINKIYHNIKNIIIYFKYKYTKFIYYISTYQVKKSTLWLSQIVSCLILIIQFDN